MERIISKMPTQTELEWFINGGSGGRDKEGVAVRINTEEMRLEPDPNFVSRNNKWLMTATGFDTHSLYEMPGRKLLSSFLNGKAVFNRERHIIEATRIP